LRFLYKPTGHAEKQLPAVLVVHGGPSGQDVDRFNSMTQSLTQAGFVFQYKLSRFYWLWETFPDLNNKIGRWRLEETSKPYCNIIDQGLVDKKQIDIGGSLVAI
jgi:dipeptidyl aminopeptidase/acylaminoacyl peptidase